MDVEAMKNMNYYQIISAMGKEAIKRKKAEGQTMHLAPLGWKNVKINGISTVEIDFDTFGLIQQARRLRREGKSIRKICRIMAERGLRSQRNNTIGPSAMLKLLKNSIIA
jgi:hypothetical protein